MGPYSFLQLSRPRILESEEGMASYKVSSLLILRSENKRSMGEKHSSFCSSTQKGRRRQRRCHRIGQRLAVPQGPSSDPLLFSIRSPSQGIPSMHTLHPCLLSPSTCQFLPNLQLQSRPKTLPHISNCLYGSPINSSKPAPLPLVFPNLVKKPPSA